MVTSLLSKLPDQKPNLAEGEKQEIMKTATDSNRPLIEVISSTPNEGEDAEIEFEEEKHSSTSMSDMDVKLLKSYSYGFNNLYQDVFKHRKEDLADFAELDPEVISQDDRKSSQLQVESK